MPAKPNGPCVPSQSGAVREKLLDPCCPPLRISSLQACMRATPMPTSVTEVAIYSQTSEFSNTFRSKVVDDLRYKSLSGEPLGDSPPRLSRAQARNATLSAGARADKPVKTDCAISPIVLWFALSRTLPRLSDGFRWWYRTVFWSRRS
jgi:hypothetical protein